MKSTDFLDTSAYLRVLEKRVLSSDAIERIADAPDADETLKLISQESEYDFSSVKTPQEYEKVLKEELKRVYGLMYELCPYAEVVDIAACKYDFHNLKVALKAKALRASAYLPYIEASRLSPELIAAAVDSSSESASDSAQAKHKNGLPAHLAEAAEEAEAIFISTGNPQTIDIVLDKKMFAHMINLSQNMNNDFISEYVRLSIDFYNVKTLMRTRQMQKGTSFLNDALVSGGLIPVSFFVENYNKSDDSLSSVFYYKYMGDVFKAGMEAHARDGSFAGLERLLDNLLLSHIKKSKSVPFGAEIFLSYILSKENEIRQIRIIMTCKLNSIGADILKERLRDNYA